MAKFNSIRNSFLGGEVSPRVNRRTDLKQYNESCETLLNTIVYPQGGTGRRPGTIYAGLEDMADISAKTTLRLVPYIFSKTQAYLLAFAPEAATVVSFVYTAGVYMWDLTTGLRVDVFNISTTNELNGIPKWAGFTTAAAVNEFQYTQIGTTIFFTHQDFPPFCIRLVPAKLGNSAFFNLVPHFLWTAFFARYGSVGGSQDHDGAARSFPFTDRNTDRDSFSPYPLVTATASHTSGTNRTITFSPTSNAPGVEAEGRLIRITNATASKTGVAVVKTANVGFGTLTVDILVDFGDTSASDNWALSMWGKSTGVAGQVGWPRTIWAHENRLYFGGNIAYPGTIWGSRIGDVGEFMQEHFINDSPNTVTNDDPYSVQIAAEQNNVIQWGSSGKTLVIGTFGREYLAQGPDETQVLGPLNIGFTPQTAYGSSLVMALRAQNTVLFVQRSGEKIREFVFNFQEDAFKAPELTKLAEHCVKKRIDITAALDREINVIKALVLQEADNGIIWCLDTTGQLFGITRDRDQDVAAFHFQKIGGALGTRDEGKVLSICTAPSVNTLGNHDDLYIAVRRTINGSDVTTIEYITKEFQAEEMYNESAYMQNKPIFSDCSLRVKAMSASLTHTIAHLPSTLVDVIADGFYIGQKTLSGSGVLTLDVAATEVIVGLPYRSIVKPLPWDSGSIIGSAVGAMKRFDQVDIEFVRTIGAKFGPSLDRLEDINFRPANLNMDTPIPLYTGSKNMKFPVGYDRAQTVVVVQDLPLPFQVNSITARGVTND